MKAEFLSLYPLGVTVNAHTHTKKLALSNWLKGFKKIAGLFTWAMREKRIRATSCTREYFIPAVCSANQGTMSLISSGLFT